MDGERGLRRASGAGPLSLLIALAAFAAFLTAFVFRNADDNRLTSWRWVFADVHLAAFAPLVLAAIALAYALRRVGVAPRGAGLWLFVASFAAGAAFWSAPEVIVDAARYFTQAQHLALHGAGAFASAWGNELTAWTDLPLVPFLYGLIFRLAGEERLYVQVFTTLLFAGTVVLTYRVGAELWDEALGFSAGILLLGMPYLLAQVPLMLVDVPAMFFLALAVFTAIKAFKLGGAGWIAASGASVVLVLLSKYSAWLMLTVLIPIVAVYARAAPGAALRRAALVIAPGALVLIALFLARQEVASAQLSLLWDYQRPGLGRWQESFVSTFLFQIHPFITAAAAYSLYAAFTRKDPRYAIAGWLLALALLGGFGRSRYLIPLLPMLALMAAYGLREIRSGEARMFAAGCAVTTSLVVAFFAYLPFLQSASATNLRQAAAYLDGAGAPRVEVLTLEQTRAGVHPAISVPLLDLHLRQPLVYHPDPAAGASPPDVARSPLRFTWEYGLPRHYRPQAPAQARAAVALILSDPSQPLTRHAAGRLAGHCLSREFMTTENVYGYQTLVRVYEPPPAAGQPCPERGAE
jgi:hypothetical protein